MLSRRELLVLGAAMRNLLPGTISPFVDGLPQVDYHVHIGDELTVAQAVQISERRGMKFGLLQHAGEADSVTPSAMTPRSTLGCTRWMGNRCLKASKPKPSIRCLHFPKRLPGWTTFLSAELPTRPGQGEIGPILRVAGRKTGIPETTPGGPSAPTAPPGSMEGVHFQEVVPQRRTIVSISDHPTEMEYHD
jgi:hypothetical protein